jgi:hypothetical protein
MSKIETNVIKPELKFIENELEYIILDTESESVLDSKIADIEAYMNNTTGKGKPTEEKDAIYGTAQDLWKEYALSLKETKYNFFLNRQQYQFLTDLILRNMEYDVNTVFFAIELTDLLRDMKNLKHTNDLDLIPIPVNATEITYIYHLISTYKVKGLTKQAYLFAQILRKIGDISKVFNYYDTAAKGLNTDIQNWAFSFEDGVELENRKTKTKTETVKGTVVESEVESEVENETK